MRREIPHPPEPQISLEALEAIYAAYNRPRYVRPDPVELLQAYPELPDRELAGLVTACLSYGRVQQILKSASNVLYRMGPSPAAFVRETSPEEIRRIFADFKHRVTTGEKLAELLIGIRRVGRVFGSLEAALVADLRDEERDTVRNRRFLLCNDLPTIPLPNRGLSKSVCRASTLSLARFSLHFATFRYSEPFAMSRFPRRGPGLGT